MRLLELFCGTKSVSKALPDVDEVLTLDNDPKCQADVCRDILEWDYRTYPPGYWDAIWASPPCEKYSVMNPRGKRCDRDLTHSNAVVQKTLEIIRYFQPKVWFLENPQTGMLKDQKFMSGIPFVDADYCQYSDWGYRKRTRFWTNKKTLWQLKLCPGPLRCVNMSGKRHSRSLQSVRTKVSHRIPPDLVRALFNGADLEPQLVHLTPPVLPGSQVSISS